MPYVSEVPEYGTLMTVEEFKNAVTNGFFIDYDGSGEPAKILVDKSVSIRPSKVNEIPADATHIVWYNK